MKLGSIHIENYRSLGVIDLDFLPDEVACWALIAPYGTGKSSFLEAIEWALEDTKPKERVDECIRLGADYVQVNLKIYVAGNGYLIERYRNRDGARSLRLLIENGGIILEGDRLYDDIQKRIDGILGEEITREILEASVIGSQGKIESFIMADPAVRRDVLAGITGGERFMEKATTAGKLGKDCFFEQKTLRAIAAECDINVQKLDDARKKLAETEQGIIECQLDILENEAKMELAEASMVEAQTRLHDAETLAQRLDILRKEYLRITTEIRLRDNDSELVTARQSLRSYLGALDKLQLNTNAASEQLKNDEASLLTERKRYDDGATVALELSEARQRLAACKERQAIETHEQSSLHNARLERIWKELEKAQTLRERNSSLRSRRTSELESRQKSELALLERSIRFTEETAGPALRSRKELGCDGSAKCVLMQSANEAADKLENMRLGLETTIVQHKEKLSNWIAECELQDRAEGLVIENIQETYDKTKNDYDNEKKQLCDELELQVGRAMLAVSAAESKSGGVSIEQLKHDLMLSTENVEKSKRQYDFCISQIENLEHDIGVAKNVVAVYDGWVSAQTTRQNAIKDEAESLGPTPDILNLRAIYSGLQNEMAAFKKMIKAFTGSLDQHGQEKAKLEEIIQSTSKSLERRDELLAQSNAKEQEAEHWTLLQKWLRLVPHLLIERLLPAIQDVTNEYLSRLTASRADGALSIRFPRPGDSDYQGGKRERLDIMAVDAVGARRAESLSGGEKAWVALALRFALARAAVGRSGASIDLVALDEPFTGLDSEGLTEIPDVIHQLAGMGHQIVLISHIPEVQDIANRKLYLERVPGEGTIAFQE